MRPTPISSHRIRVKGASAELPRRGKRLMLMMKSLALSIGLLLGVGYLAGSQPALASCAGLPAAIGEVLGTAPVVFVGTVTGTSDGDRTATVHVDELWRGPVLPAVVTLHGSPDVSAAATSVDRHYQNGRQYLFVPQAGGGSDFTDNSCSPTREFGSDLGPYRPASVRRYPPSPPGPPLLPLAVSGLILASAAIVLVRRRARRNLVRSSG